MPTKNKPKHNYTATLFCCGIIGLFSLAYAFMYAFSRGLVDHEFTALNFAVTNWHGHYKGESNGMLFFIGPLRWCWALFGDSELALRASSIVAIFLSVPLIYFTAEEIKGKDGLNNTSWVGVFSALFFTLNPVVIFSSQHCRFYALNIFLCISSFLVLLIAVKKDKAYWWLLYLCLTIFSVGTTVSSLLVFVSQWIYYLVVSANKKRALTRVLCFALLSFSFYLFLKGNDPNALERIRHYDKITVPFCFEILSWFTGVNNRFIDNSDFDLAWNTFPLYLMPFMLLLYGIYTSIKKVIIGKRLEYLLILLWFFVPITAIIGGSILFRPLLAWRTLFFIIPGFSVLLGIAADSLTPKLRILMLVGYLILGPSLVIPHYYYEGQGMKPKLTFVDQMAKKEQIVVFVEELGSSYYLGKNKRYKSLLIRDNLYKANLQNVKSVLEEVSLRLKKEGKPQAVWLIYSLHQREAMALYSKELLFSDKFWFYFWKGRDGDVVQLVLCNPTKNKTQDKAKA